MEIASVQQCYTQFGAFMREGRQKKQVLQTELAKMLNVTQAYISQLEAGTRNVELGLALEICDVLDLDMRKFIDIMRGKEEEGCES